MYRIERTGDANDDVRLTSSSALTVDDFAAVARELGMAPARARKSGYVSARVSTKAERIDVHWNGKETEIAVEPGDFLVTSLDGDRAVLRDADGQANTYAIKPAKFAEFYKRATGATEFGDIYAPFGIVEALRLGGGFEIMAPWGEAQRADAGYLIKNGDDIYGNNKDTFEATYSIIA